MFSIDLKEAYFQIPIHLDSWPYLRFCLEGRVYQFRALCFGLSSALQVFTRVFSLILESASSVIWMTGWSLRSHCPFCSIGILFSSCEGPEYCNQLGEVGPPLVHSCPASGHIDRHFSQEGVSARGSAVLVSGSDDFLSGSSVTIEA